MSRLSLVAILGALFISAAAAAETPYDSSYDVELTRGALVAPTRILGIGGAFVSIAEGAGSYDLNPASAAIRSRHNKDELWDWDFALEAVFTPRDSNDFENNRRGTGSELGSGLGAIGFMVQEFGFGVSVTVATIELPPAADGTVTALNAGTMNVVSAYNLMDGQLVMGGGISFGVGTATVDEVDVMSLFGVGLSAGGVVIPKGEPYRFGFSVRTRTRLRPDEMSTVAGELAGGVVTPKSMVIPAQLRIGGAYSVGARADNVTATFGVREPAADEALPASRELATVSVDVVFTERLERAAGFQAWAENELQIAGEEISIGLHAGIEGELVEGLLKARLGGYFEPSRFDDVGRVHATAGLDLYLFQLVWDWRAAVAADLARRYSNVVVSLGFWY